MPHYNVLFLCTGNSARSIMAEAIMNRRGAPNFTAYSAGSHPAGAVRPEALRQLQMAGLSTEGLRSKSWDEFAAPGAPQMHFVFTVCDNAARESLSSVAGAAHDGALGRARSGGRGGHACGDREGLSRCVHDSGAAHLADAGAAVGSRWIRWRSSGSWTRLGWTAAGQFDYLYLRPLDCDAIKEPQS